MARSKYIYEVQYTEDDWREDITHSAYFTVRHEALAFLRKKWEEDGKTIEWLPSLIQHADNRPHVTRYPYLEDEILDLIGENP